MKRAPRGAADPRFMGGQIRKRLYGHDLFFIRPEYCRCLVHFIFPHRAGHILTRILSFFKFRKALVVLESAVIFGYAYPLPRPPIKERVHMLTEIPKDEVSLPKGTSGDILDGVSRAGVILDNCDKLLVPRTL